MSFVLDHIAIAADTLEQGVKFIEQKFGVTIPFGGVHDQMGTHNHLMQIGNGIFLELIAINPNGQPPKPPQNRWFDLDNSLQQITLKTTPKLVTWIARTPNLKSELKNLGANIGNIHQVSRGTLNWQISIPQNGRLIESGLLPTLIEWQNNQTPAPKMANLGIRLSQFTLTHPQPKKLEKLLTHYKQSSQFDLVIQQGEYGLSAKFTNAQGQIINL